VEAGLPVPVILTVYEDRSYTVVVKSQPAAYLLRRDAKVDKGSKTPNTSKVGKVTRAQLEEIATMKQGDLTAASLETAVRTIAGTARSMGIEVEGVT